MVFKGVVLKGLSLGGWSLRLVAQAYFCMNARVKDLVTLPSGNRVSRVDNYITTNLTTIYLSQSDSTRYIRYGTIDSDTAWFYATGSGQNLADTTASALTNFDFAHTGVNHSIFFVLRQDSVGDALMTYFGTAGVTTAHKGFWFGVDNRSGSSRSRCLAILYNGILTYTSPNNTIPLATPFLIEIRYTRTGTTNEWKIYKDGALLTAQTNTTAVKAAGQTYPLGIFGANGNPVNNVARIGNIFFVKNVGKTSSEVEAESLQITNDLKAFYGIA